MLKGEGYNTEKLVITLAVTGRRPSSARKMLCGTEKKGGGVVFPLLGETLPKKRKKLRGGFQVMWGGKSTKGRGGGISMKAGKGKARGSD